MTSDTAARPDDLNDRAGEEWESLRLLSFHGAPWDESVMLADLTREDVAKIEELINELAASRRALLSELATARQERDLAVAALDEAQRRGTTPAEAELVVVRRQLAEALELIAVALKQEPYLGGEWGDSARAVLDAGQEQG